MAAKQNSKATRANRRGLRDTKQPGGTPPRAPFPGAQATVGFKIHFVASVACSPTIPRRAMINNDQYVFLFVWRLAQSRPEDDKHERNAGRQRPAPRDATRSETPPKPLFTPFPLARRRKLIDALASKMATAPTDIDADRIFQGQAARLGRGLRRKRVAERVIERELRGLEAAVWAELRRVWFGSVSKTGSSS